VVHDTGVGVPEDRRDQVFQSFTQVDSSTTRIYGGTGLGLAICKRLTEQMEGEMWLESKVGVGSRFHFTAMVVLTYDEDQHTLEGEQEALAGKRALIAEDNRTHRRLLSMQLEQWGMEVYAAASGKEALAQVERGKPFDIGILDMHMAEMDGVALARAIRTHRSAKALPLMMLNSILQPYDADGVLFNSTLNKPVKQAPFLNALVNLVRVREKQEVVNQAVDDAAEAQEELSLRFLLAEDNDLNQKVFNIMLEREGYDSDVVSNGFEALKAMERKSYDIVFMDMHMPVMDGLDATREIRARYPGNKPYIIAMTGNVLQGVREECLQAGMNDYLSKPVQRNDLKSALRKAITTISAEMQEQTL
jgi:CheY-like chemotaxis protein